VENGLTRADQPKLLLFLHPLSKNEFHNNGALNIYPYNQMVNNVLIDKIDPYHCKSIVYSIDEIINHPSSGKSFEELMFERAAMINSWDQKIFLKYSGGTDSTSALLSMMRSWSNADLQKLNIVMTANSVEEFPELWPEIKQKFEGRIFDALEKAKVFHERGIVITGEAGDQLFGSSVLRIAIKNFGINSIHERWTEVMPKMYLNTFDGDKEQTTAFVKRYYRTLAKCPFPIRSVFDWVWWFNYTNKVQHVLLRDLAFEPETAKTYLEKHRSFYYTLDFLKWSLDNHDKKIKKSYKSYKYTSKDFIEKYTGFTEHHDRFKVGSRTRLWHPNFEKTRFEYATPIGELNTNKEFMFAINENFEYISLEEAQSYVRSHYDY
jgi:hypothetical protein